MWRAWLTPQIARGAPLEEIHPMLASEPPLDLDALQLTERGDSLLTWAARHGQGEVIFLLTEMGLPLSRRLCLRRSLRRLSR